MTVKLTIVGLGRIGGSIGLALKGQSQKITRYGHDKDPSVARQAEKAGAVDKVTINLISAVSGADLVILAIPLDQIQETLRFIGPELRNGAVVMDTGPLKELVAQWASEYLPKERYYVGLTPVINPKHLYTTSAGFSAAHADLFEQGLMAIVAPPETNSEALKLATDLISLLGAKPYFADILEMDGLMAATHLLPQIMATSLITATVDQPGWREGQKIAGKHYAGSTTSLLDENELKSLGTTAVLGKKNVVRVLDNLIMVLQSIREGVVGEDQEFIEELVNHALESRAQWWVKRQSLDSISGEALTSELPTSADMFGRLFGIRKKTNPKKR